MSAVLKFKGTPGKWRAEEDITGGEWIIYGEADGEIIDGRIIDGSPLVSYSVENEADAHLIAAAPELLEALQGILNLFESERCWTLSDYAGENEYDLIKAALSQAGTAVAKALQP